MHGAEGFARSEPEHRAQRFTAARSQGWVMVSKRVWFTDRVTWIPSRAATQMSVAYSVSRSIPSASVRWRCA